VGRVENWERIHDAATRIYGRSLYIDDTPNIKLSTLKGRMRRMRRQGVEMVIIDYLTLIQHRSRGESSYDRIGEITMTLKGMARELMIPVVVLAQVKRLDKERMPHLADLAESGRIEQDADVVIFLHRKLDEDFLYLQVAKQRNGPLGRVKLAFSRQYQSIHSLTTVDEYAASHAAKE